MKPLFLITWLLMLISCSENAGPKTNPLSSQELIALNKERHIAEMTWIRNYIATLNMTMQEGSTGFYYTRFEQGNDSIQPGDEVEIDYHIFHLTTPAYTQEIFHDRKAIKVENDNSEIGIHQALQLLLKGDSAIFIMPSHLAFGLTGNKMVNPNTPLLYTIRVLPDNKTHAIE